MASYLPSREPELRDWVVNYSTLISAAPATYGLVVVDATTIAAAVNDFVAKYIVATDPVTRTLGSVAAKNGAKAQMITIIQSYSARIKATAGVSDEDKINLGLNPGRNLPTTVPAPSTYPVVALSIAAPLRIEVKLSDSASPDQRAKPNGVVGCQVFVSTDATPPAKYTRWQFGGFATRDTFELLFDSDEALKVARVICRWQNRKGETGPWSPIQAMAVVGP